METNVIAVCGNRVPYAAVGTGSRCLVVIPGASIHPVAAAAARMFRSFAPDCRVYIFDRPEVLEPGTTVQDMAELTAAAMEQLGIRGADLFGASQGGMMALCIALEHPELVGQLYLSSTLARQNDTSRETFDLWLDPSLDGAALKQAVNQRIYSPAFYEKYRRLLEAGPEVTGQDLRRFRILVEACRSFDVYSRLAELRCPVFTVGGENDRVLSSQGTTEIAHALGCPIHLYPNGSHAVYDEEPDFRPRMKKLLGL